MTRDLSADFRNFARQTSRNIDSQPLILKSDRSAINLRLTSQWVVWRNGVSGMVPCVKKGRTMEAQGTGVTRVWLEKVQELTQEHEALEASCLSRHQAVEKWFAGRMKDLAERREGLFANPEDLVVLVRTTQGGDLEVYHSAAGTCRRLPGSTSPGCWSMRPGGDAWCAVVHVRGRESSRSLAPRLRHEPRYQQGLRAAC